MFIATIIAGAPIHAWIGFVSLITTVLVFNCWLKERHSLQLFQWLCLAMIAILNTTEYWRLGYFTGVDVDPLISKTRSALDSYDSNLYWHHLLWFLTPVLLLGVVLSNLGMLWVMKKGGKKL